MKSEKQKKGKEQSRRKGNKKTQKDKITEDDPSFEFGGMSNRDLKKDLGCGG